MFKVVTLGCRLNAYESEVMKEKLSHLDDVIVVNTCAVTGEAERQCRQTIRKLKTENPTAKIIVTGCAAQLFPQSLPRWMKLTWCSATKKKQLLKIF